jgi:hypothetical protein
LLAGTQNVIGLGEVRHMAGNRFRDNLSAKCACGYEARYCRVWGELIPKHDETPVDWYTRLVHTVPRRYPNVTHLIDSSKTRDGIMPWLELEKKGVISGIRIIYLVRDFRGWVLSFENMRRRKNRSPRIMIHSILSWWYSQRSFLKFLKNEGKQIEFKVVSYESLLFQANTQLSRVSIFLGLPPDDMTSQDRLKRAVIHDVFGNRIIKDPSKRTQLTYDDRWQYNMLLNMWSLIVIPAWRINIKLRKEGGINKS